MCSQNDLYAYDYNAKFNLKNTNTSWVQIINLTGENKKVLDIGCAKGHLTRFFKDNNCSITAVELIPEFAAEAKKYCEKIIVGNIENEETILKIKDRYDVIVLGDIIEHLFDPWKLLTKLKNFLEDDGYMVLSMPNIAHWSVRWNLFKGIFEYHDKGILDRTHLRFFTLKTAKRLIKQASLTYDYFGFKYDVPFLRRRPFRYLKLNNPRIAHAITKLWPGLFAFQFIFRLKKTK